MPVFDSGFDTFESLHERSPFAFDCICYVAAKVRDGGGMFSMSSVDVDTITHPAEGLPSETHLKCWEEVQTISCATLFAPVQRQEAVQAMSELSLL